MRTMSDMMPLDATFSGDTAREKQTRQTNAGQSRSSQVNIVQRANRNLRPP